MENQSSAVMQGAFSPLHVIDFDPNNGLGDAESLLEPSNERLGDGQPSSPSAAAELRMPSGPGLATSGAVLRSRNEAAMQNAV